MNVQRNARNKIVLVRAFFSYSVGIFTSAYNLILYLKLRMGTEMVFMFDGKMKAVTFSYDDGVTQDIRLIALFNRII